MPGASLQTFVEEAGHHGLAYASVTTPTDTLVFLGSYTDHSVLPHWPRGTKEGKGIVVCRWRDGKLEIVRTIECLNPAFMKYHPYLNVLYVLTECIHQKGYITAYSVDPFNADLTELGRCSMTGKSTCYISFDKQAKHAIISNYWDGIMNVVELDSEGVPLRVVQEHQQTRRDTWRQVTCREDHMANRMDGPHAHCNVFHPSYKWVFVPDLGDNCIHQYGYESGRLVHQTHVPLPAGDGPRHFVFHPTLPVAYSGCELRSHVQVFAVDESNPEEVKARITPVQSLSTLPEDFRELNYVSEIKIDKAGHYVYISNRGHNSIAVYAVDQTNGSLSLVSIDSTLGKCPRHFGLSPCGKYAVVGDQDSDSIKIFNVSQTGSLSYTGVEYDMASPNFVLFQLPHPVTVHLPEKESVEVPMAMGTALAVSAC